MTGSHIIVLSVIAWGIVCIIARYDAQLTRWFDRRAVRVRARELTRDEQAVVRAAERMCRDACRGRR